MTPTFTPGAVSTRVCIRDNCTGRVHSQDRCEKHYRYDLRYGHIKPRSLPETARGRIESRIDVQATGCWVWKGRIESTGYGTLYWQNVRWFAHRLSYEAFVGPIPDGLYIDHLCRNPPCVNPKHLEPVTPYENVARGLLPGMKGCRKHKFDNGVIRWGRSASPEGITRPHWRCRTCAKEGNRRRARLAGVQPRYPDREP